MNEDSKDERVKTVYAHFGLALYLAQVLEHSLANALMYAELLPRRAGKPVSRKQWRAEFDGFMNQQFERTLGRLIRGLGKATTVSTNLECLLTDALKTRNFLAHHFFRERAESFMSRDGRDRMIEELEQAQKLFEVADERLTEVAKPLRERYGLTDEKLKPFEQGYINNFENDL